MAGRTRIVPSVRGGMLRAEEHLPPGGAAAGAPTVVLAHGWTLTRRSWQPVVDALLARRDVRVVTYDQRGHGTSTMGDVAPTIGLLGDDLATIVAALAPDGPLVLGGHSMGGMAVMAYAGRHPEDLRARARGVVLVSTAASIEGRRAIPLETLVMQACSRAPGIRAGRLVPVSVQRRLIFGEGADPRDVREAVRQIQRTKMPTIGQYFTALSEHDELASLAHLEGVPTRILVGSRDRLTPRRWSVALHEQIPGSELTVLDGLGHMLTYEATDVVADALVAMVDGGVPAPPP